MRGEIIVRHVRVSMEAYVYSMWHAHIYGGLGSTDWACVGREPSCETAGSRLFVSTTWCERREIRWHATIIGLNVGLGRSTKISRRIGWRYYPLSSRDVGSEDSKG